MNSTTYDNSFIISYESWFIPLNILGILCLVLAMIFTLTFLVIIVLDKTCHTVRMMLVANICLTGFICSSAHFILTAFILYNDLNQIQYQDSFCVFRGYSSYVSLALHIYSYLVSAIYQYVIIVYPTSLFWKSAKIHLSLIILSWILALVCPLPFTSTSQIIYNIDNQICQVPFRLSWSVIYIPQFIYIIPITLIVFIYIKLVRYVKEMSQHITLSNTMARTQRDFNMFRRIVIIVHSLLIAGFPMSFSAFLSFANLAPKYHFRIGFMFVYIILPILMLALFQFTNLLQASVRKRIIKSNC